MYIFSYICNFLDIDNNEKQSVKGVLTRDIENMRCHRFKEKLFHTTSKCFAVDIRSLYFLLFFLFFGAEQTLEKRSEDTVVKKEDSAPKPNNNNNIFPFNCLLLSACLKWQIYLCACLPNIHIFVNVNMSFFHKMRF